MKVNVLGTNYAVKLKKYSEDEYFKQANCNGYCSNLLKEIVLCEMSTYGDSRYSLSLYDGDKNVTHSFTHVKLEDVTFSGGVITFGG